MTLTDEPVDGRRLRRDRNRDAVVQALLELYREGDLSPSTDDVAARAGISARSLFRYFEDVDTLVETAIAKQQEHLRPLYPLAIDADAALDARIDAFVAARVRLLEGMGEVGQVARAVAAKQPRVAGELRRIRGVLRDQVAEVFASELAALGRGERDSVRAALDVATSWEAHHLLRSDQGLSRAAATRAMRLAVSRLLGDR
jgi:AcrR family transcriptional regulator